MTETATRENTYGYKNTNLHHHLQTKKEKIYTE